MERAVNDGVILALNATPIGYEVYGKLGFRALGKHEARVEGEEECVVFGLWCLKRIE